MVITDAIIPVPSLPLTDCEHILLLC